MDMPIFNSNSFFQKLDLSALKHFYAIATFGGFSKAARASGISQPALSLGLQKLEKTLGVRLIDRDSKRFTLTREGFTLLSSCQRIESVLETLVGSLGSSSARVRKRLRIGAALSIGIGPLAKGCAAQARSRDPMELELTTQRTYSMLTGILSGTLDAAIVPDDVYEAGLRFVRIHEDRLVFVVGKAHKKKFEQNKNPWLLAASDLPLLAYPRETPLRSLVDKLCLQNGIRFKSVFSADGLDAIKTLLLEGAGGAFILRTLILPELEDGELIETRPPFALPKSGIALATREGEQGDEISKTVREMIQI
jgi:DNA-binding transcriptional LysR family regulator